MLKTDSEPTRLPFLDLPAGFLASLGQRVQKIMPVDIVQVDGLPAVAPAHEVIHGARILQTRFAWHDGRLDKQARPVKPATIPHYGLTPLMRGCNM